MAPIRTERLFARPSPLNLPPPPIAMQQPAASVGKTTYMAMCTPSFKSAPAAFQAVATPSTQTNRENGLKVGIEWAGSPSRVAANRKSASSASRTAKDTDMNRSVLAPAPAQKKPIFGDPQGSEFVKRLSQFNQMEQVCHINYLAKMCIERLGGDRNNRVGAVLLACVTVCEAPEPCPALTRLFLQNPIEKLIDLDDNIVPELLTKLESQRRDCVTECRKEIVGEVIVIVIEHWNKRKRLAS